MLRERWRAVVADADPAAAAAAFDDIVRRHAEPHRCYHTLDHVLHVVERCHRWSDAAEDEAAVILAAFLHDVVYDPRSGTNEADSARVARRLLAPLRVPPRRIEEVARLIETTAAHRVGPDDRNAAVLADADLAILGAAPDEYRGYVGHVRAEYAWVDDDAWRAGRGRLLDDFLARPRLFVTEAAFSALEQSARANLEWERSTLT